MTLAQWLEQHPEASAVPAKAGQFSGGQWVYPEDETAARSLATLADYKVAHRSANVCFLRPVKPRNYKYGGPIPIKELDLPRREESEADRLLPDPLYETLKPGDRNAEGTLKLVHGPYASQDEVPTERNEACWGDGTGQWWAVVQAHTPEWRPALGYPPIKPRS